MSDTTIERPVFYDGQILDASDLGDSVDYARDQLARHERYGHSWGIYFGFGLTFDSAAGTVTVAAGMAIDGRGRELALLADQSLDPNLFLSAHVYDPSPSQKDAWYPVFVRGILSTVPPTSSMGACAAASQSTRESEDVQFVFKPLGSVAPNSPALPVPGPDVSPDLPSGGSPWDVLIGFVQWSATPAPGQFTNAQPMNGDLYPVRRRLAGVSAARVEGGDGAVALQTSDNSSQLMVVVQEAVGSASGSMTFGTPNGLGGVTSLFSVDDKGNLSVSGTITSSSPLSPGALSVQSGLATDGVVLPLPPGVSDDDVAKGAIVLHVQVEPVIPNVSKLGSSAPFAALPLTCHVDQNQRVHCVIRSLSWTGGAIVPADAPGTCRYLVIAASPGTGGS